MAEVRFLDGPLRGQIREIPELSDGLPRTVHAPARVRFVEYQPKRSFYADGPRWVAAVTPRCGDPVVAVVPFMGEVLDLLPAAAVEQIDRGGRAALERMTLTADSGVV